MKTYCKGNEYDDTVANFSLDNNYEGPIFFNKFSGRTAQFTEEIVPRNPKQTLQLHASWKMAGNHEFWNAW